MSYIEKNNKLEQQLYLTSKDSFIDENYVVRNLVDYIQNADLPEEYIKEHAIELIEATRNTEHSIADTLLHHYGLGTNEGRQIMRLSEAILRIPDEATIDELIADTLANIEIPHDKTRKLDVTKISDNLLKMVSSILGGKNIWTQLGKPTIRTAIRKSVEVISHSFIIAEKITAAVEKSYNPSQPNYLYSFDMLGESARTHEQADNYTDAYINAAETVGRHNNTDEGFYSRNSISIKLSALHPNYHLMNYNAALTELLPRLKKIVMVAMQNEVAVTIDAEELAKLDISILIFKSLLDDEKLANYQGIGLAIQAYSKRSLEIIDLIAEIGEEYNRIIPVRLVKGAYWDTEIKHAQEQGFENYQLFTKKEYTDIAFIACAIKMIKKNHAIYPQFATHNARTIATIMSIASPEQCEFQRLYGMGREIYDVITENYGYRCRTYAPVGAYKDLLAYLIRRLIENCANNSFVNQMYHVDIDIEDLIKNPVDAAEANNFMPADNIPMPEDIFGKERHNSFGMDLDNLYSVTKIQECLFTEIGWLATPLIYEAPIKFGNKLPCYAPYNTKLQIGSVINADTKLSNIAVDNAKVAFNKWSKTSVYERANILRNVADLLAKHQIEAMNLCIREAGKTLANSISEIREAIDFLRFYANKAEELLSRTDINKGITGELNTVSLHSRGVFVCISPWNFPLAIFAGQIAAALATGNTVIAKPAEQTPLVAYFITQLFHKAGVPLDVLQLVTGNGERVGKALVSHPEISGVCFTGSMDTAKLINRQIATKNNNIIPLIAETGGQNCMIVDSSTLLEQAVDDIVHSAFDSSGQRCSALRVVYIQDEIYDDLVKMIVGAMQALNIGSPEDLSTNIASVIDDDAMHDLNKHIHRMRRKGKLLYACKLIHAITNRGYYVTPHLFELDSITQLKKESFGPILHVVKYSKKNLQDVIDEINSTGYGLTFGVHSRIKSNYENIIGQVKAGNSYVNRTTIGAIVESQPFGGEGLSGTGFKAGGKYYLLKFLTERAVSINTAAIGMNADLINDN